MWVYMLALFWLSWNIKEGFTLKQGCLSILADNGLSRYDNIDIIVIMADDNKYRLRIISIDKRFYLKFDKFRYRKKKKVINE